MTLINRTTQNSIRTILAAALLMAIPVLAVAVHAQGGLGAQFTLPYEVHWNKAVVPAGEYIMMFRQANHSAILLSTHGTRSYLIGLPIVSNSQKDNGGLVVTSAAGQHTVRALNLPQVGIRYVFSPISDSEREQLAKAGQIDSVSVTAKK